MTDTHPTPSAESARTRLFDLTGRVALVTGAGQGVGTGITATLAAQGAKVAVNDVDGDRCAAATERLVEQGAHAVAVPFDVTDSDAVDEAVARIAADLGPVDILVNNAGVPAGMTIASFREMDPDEWSRTMDLNVYGSLNCIHAVLDGMCDRGHGRVIQISSGAARTGIRLGVSLYGASKSAIEGFLRHLSQEVARTGVTVNAVALGLMGSGDDEQTRDETASIARQIPVGRLGRPSDVGAAVVYLASDEAEWLTGQALHLNGGSITL